MLTQGKHTIIAFGDSITAPRNEGGKDLTVYADILRSELPKYGITGQVLNKGIGGHTTKDAMARFDGDVLDQNPNLVIFMFGMNDSAVDNWKSPPATGPRVSMEEFVANLTTMIRTLRAKGAEVIVVTPNPRQWGAEYVKLYGKSPYDVNDPMGFNHLHTGYVQAVRDLAVREAVPMIDLYAMCLAYHATLGNTMNDLFTDGVHLNDKGQCLLAEALIGLIVGTKS
jgi:lysophospholipase L1-like esterase